MKKIIVIFLCNSSTIRKSVDLPKSADDVNEFIDKIQYYNVY